MIEHKKNICYYKYCDDKCGGKHEKYFIKSYVIVNFVLIPLRSCLRIVFK